MAAGFDPTKPSAWIAEGLFGYLPPEAQDRLLDAVTSLSAPGSRLGSEAVPNIGDADHDAARAKMREATAKWREHGFDLDFSELGYQGERHDVGAVPGRPRLAVGRHADGRAVGGQRFSCDTAGRRRSDRR